MPQMWSNVRLKMNPKMTFETIASMTALTATLMPTAGTVWIAVEAAFLRVERAGLLIACLTWLSIGMLHPPRWLIGLSRNVIPAVDRAGQHVCFCLRENWRDARFAQAKTRSFAAPGSLATPFGSG